MLTLRTLHLPVSASVFLESLLLKRAGVPPQQLLHFYTAVIRPVLEYASPVWHYRTTPSTVLNRAQSQHLESIQKRALHIIFNLIRGSNYLICCWFELFRR